jgi:hypothetical protein
MQMGEVLSGLTAARCGNLERMSSCIFYYDDCFMERVQSFATRSSFTLPTCMSSDGVVPVGCMSNFVITSRTGKSVAVRRILDNEEREYLRELMRTTDALVVDGYVGLLSTSIRQKSSLAIVEYGKREGIYSLVKLGTLLFVHFCDNRSNCDANIRFMNEFSAAVDQALEEIQLKSAVAALGTSRIAGRS